MKKKIIPVSLIILFSIVLWGSVSLSGDYVTTVSVPIRLIDLPKNYTSGYVSDKEVYIRIKSKGWEIAKIELGGEFEFVVSVHKKVGKSRLDLRHELQNNNWLTSTFQVLEIVPTHIECNVDKIISKEVSIAGNFKIDFKDGFGSASEIKIVPNRIKVFGPVSILQGLDTIRTEYSEFLNLSDPVNEEVKLEEMTGINYSQNSCTIQFEVQKIVDRSFNYLPVEIRNVPSSKELILYPSKINVVLKGGINKLGKLSNDSIKVYIDYWDIMRNNGEPIDPVVEYPSFTTLVDVVPKKLEYVIKQY